MSLLRLNDTLVRYVSPIGYKGLLGLFYSGKLIEGTSYRCCDYLAKGCSQSTDKTLNDWDFSTIGGPLNTTVIISGYSARWQDGFGFSAKSVIKKDWTAEAYYKVSNSNQSSRFLNVSFPGWPYETVWKRQSQVEFFGLTANLTNKIVYTDWNHIAFEYSKAENKIYLYINGALTFSGTPVSPTDNGPNVNLPEGSLYYNPTLYTQQLALWNKRISGGRDHFQVPGRYMDDNGNWLF